MKSSFIIRFLRNFIYSNKTMIDIHTYSTYHNILKNVYLIHNMNNIFQVFFQRLINRGVYSSQICNAPIDILPNRLYIIEKKIFVLLLFFHNIHVSFSTLLIFSKFDILPHQTLKLPNPLGRELYTPLSIKQISVIRFELNWISVISLIYIIHIIIIWELWGWN